MNPTSKAEQPRWLDEAYSLAQRGELDSAIDVLFREFDELHLAGEFTLSNRTLGLVDIERLGLELSVSVLTITRCAKEKLPSRAEFFERVERFVRANEPLRADRLLVGLR